MADIENIFLEFHKFLEAENIIKDKIRFEGKQLEKIVHAITMNIENLHKNVDDKNIRVVCQALIAELRKVRHICRRIDDVIPKGEFYRYCGPIKHQLAKLVQAAALVMYFIENKAVTLTEAGLILGLRTKNFSDAPSLPPASPGLCAATVDADSVSVPPPTAAAAAPVSGSSPDSASCVVSTPRRGPAETLAVSNDGGVTLVLTPASPLPPGSPASNVSGAEAELGEEAQSPPAACASPHPVLAASSAAGATDPSLPETDQPPATPPSSTAASIPVDVDINNPVSIKEDLGPATARPASSSVTTSSDSRVLRSQEPPLLCAHSGDSRECDSTAHLSLYLDLEDFLGGWLMVGSELARLAVNAVSSENYCIPFRINSFLRELHAGFSLLNFKNNFLRKSYDDLKYSLKKSEDVVYNLSLRQLRPTEQELQDAEPTLSSIVEFYGAQDSS